MSEKLKDFLELQEIAFSNGFNILDIKSLAQQMLVSSSHGKNIEVRKRYSASLGRLTPAGTLQWEVLGADTVDELYTKVANLKTEKKVEKKKEKTVQAETGLDAFI